jgi:hypothetical protein
MTVKLLPRTQRETIGYPSEHVNWDYEKFDSFQIRAQSDHHPGQK